jgi:hemerythrin
MAMLEWEDDFSVNVAAMDAQHKQLIAMINELYEAIQQRKGDEVIKDILPRLAQYTENHFTAEENVMSDAGFPGLMEHQQLHRKLTQKVVENVNHFLSGKKPALVDMTAFLISWLRNHIQGEDKKYGQYIADTESSRVVVLSV